MTIATFTYARIGCGAETGGFWHSRSATADMFTHTRSGHGWIYHFLTTKMVWSARFRSGRGKLGLDPFVAERILLPLRPRPATAYVWTHVMNCVEAYFPPSSARVRSRMCERTLSYVHICAERLQSGDGRILTFPLRYRGYVHTYAERTRADLSFLEDEDGLEGAVSERTRKIGCWPISCGADFAPAPPPPRDRV